jgi:hypothetical protein
MFNQLAGANALGDCAALVRGALIAPDERRPQDFIALVQQRGAMHLT